MKAPTRPTIIWPVLLVAVVVMAISAGILATHQYLTYGALVPSISGGWFGPITLTNGGNGQPIKTYSMYADFTLGSGQALTAQTSSCTVPNAPTPQPPSSGLDYAGTITGNHFAMSPHGGDIETDFTWDGTYSTDSIHLNFYVDGTPTPNNSFAILHRGTYSDYLNTCA